MGISFNAGRFPVMITGVISPGALLDCPELVCAAAAFAAKIILADTASGNLAACFIDLPHAFYAPPCRFAALGSRSDVADKWV